MKKATDDILLINSGFGIYIAQMFAACLAVWNHAEFSFGGITADERKILEEGPVSELYDDAWASVLDNFWISFSHGNNMGYFTLEDYEGDLWLSLSPGTYCCGAEERLTKNYCSSEFWGQPVTETIYGYVCAECGEPT